MKTICKDIFKALFWVVAIPLIVIVVIWIILLLPFDYIKYKSSLYYKKERKSYTFMAGQGENFRVYNEILKNDLPIMYFENPQNPAIECGKFIYNRMLIIANFLPLFEYDSECEQWTCRGEEDEDGRTELMTLDEYIEIELSETNELAGQTICDEAVVLINESCISDIERAKEESKFLIYNNNRVEVLCRLCGRVQNGKGKDIINKRPKWEDVINMMYDKNLDAFCDEVVKVIYSQDKSMRYVILKNEDNILTYQLEAIYQFNDKEWGYICSQNGALPAMWEPHDRKWGGSRFGTEEDLMKDLVAEPEYKQFFAYE